MATGYDSTKSGARASHEAIESTGGNATGVKRAQNRIHDDETKNPGQWIFTK
jgi:hypothetical protein